MNNKTNNNLAGNLKITVIILVGLLTPFFARALGAPTTWLEILPFAAFIEFWYFIAIIFVWLATLFITKKFLSNRMPNQSTLLWKKLLILLMFIMVIGDIIIFTMFIGDISNNKYHSYALWYMVWMWLVVFFPLLPYLIVYSIWHPQQKFFNTYFMSVFILVAYIISSLLFPFIGDVIL